MSVPRLAVWPLPTTTIPGSLGAGEPGSCGASCTGPSSWLGCGVLPFVPASNLAVPLLGSSLQAPTGSALGLSCPRHLCALHPPVGPSIHWFSAWAGGLKGPHMRQPLGLKPQKQLLTLPIPDSEDLHGVVGLWA